MEFTAEFFDGLSSRQVYEVLRAREAIFLLEQNIVCNDIDGVDYDALHCLLTENGALLAYLRAFRTDEGVKIGRVLSLTHGKGHGGALMRMALPVIRERFGCDTLLVHSQKHAEGFYASFGFVPTSEDFLEEGVLHVAMRLSF